MVKYGRIWYDMVKYGTLKYEINVPAGINMPAGTFHKNIKHACWKN